MSDSLRPWIIQSMGFSKPEYWTGYLFPAPGDLPSQGIDPRSPELQVDSLPAELPGKPKNGVILLQSPEMMNRLAMRAGLGVEEGRKDRNRNG